VIGRGVRLPAPHRTHKSMVYPAVPSGCNLSQMDNHLRGFFAALRMTTLKTSAAGPSTAGCGMRFLFSVDPLPPYLESKISNLEDLSLDQSAPGSRLVWAGLDLSA
jgi:hypothetical protein